MKIPAPILGAVVGTLGGLSGSLLLGASIPRGLLFGFLFGLLFPLFFASRASSPGAGLIWGLSCGFLVWVTLPATQASGMLLDARLHFPELVAILICLGLPVGLALGCRGRNPEFRW